MKPMPTKVPLRKTVALVYGIAVACACFIFASFQLIGTVIRLFFVPSVFDQRGTTVMWGLESEYYMVGDALRIAYLLALIHVCLVAVGYTIWLLKTDLRRDIERRTDEYFCAVPPRIYGSVFGFCAFGAVATSAHLPFGDFDLVAGGIYLLMLPLALIGMFIGRRVASSLGIGLPPKEQDLPRVFAKWATSTLGIGLTNHALVFWL